MFILRHSSLWADIMWPPCTMIRSNWRPSVDPLGWVCPVGSTQDLAAAICNLLPGPRLFLYGWRQVRLWLQLAALSNVSAHFGAPSGSAGPPCLGPPPQLPPFCLHPGCAGCSWGSSLRLRVLQPSSGVCGARDAWPDYGYGGVKSLKKGPADMFMIHDSELHPALQLWPESWGRKTIYSDAIYISVFVWGVFTRIFWCSQKNRINNIVWPQH